MQPLSSSTLELPNFIDYSALDESNTFEEFFANENHQPLSITKLFAFLRVWNSLVQKNFAKLISSVLQTEFDIDEYDLITGMNLLHFTCKFGAKKFRCEKEALHVLKALIEKGINLSAPCLWIQMNCLQYCAFFDSPLLCELLLKQSKVQSLLNQPCSSFQRQTALHLACSALALSTTEILLRNGAKKEILDDQQRLPSDCIPPAKNEEQQRAADAIRALLPRPESSEQQLKSSLIDSIISNSDNHDTRQFQIGERIRLNNNKMGTIKYFGSVPFGVNLWYGIELDEPTGKHDGCVGGVRYFTCPFNRGIFVQSASMQKLTPVPQSPERERRFRPINFPILDTTNVSSRIDSGLKRDSSADDRSTERYHVEDRVYLSKNRRGTIKYIGPTSLGSGLWYGIELDSPNGFHDGFLSHDGQRYFQCKSQHGVFVRNQNLRRLNRHDRQTHSLSTSLDGPPTRHSRMTASEYDAKALALPFNAVEDNPLTKSMISNIHSTTFHVGDKVYCHNHLGKAFRRLQSFCLPLPLAVIRFIGTTLFADGIWIGIEFLSRSLGKNDGSIDGHAYFQCKPNYGLFVRPNRLTSKKI